MIEDKLSKDQRIRLECLAQAVASSAIIGQANTETLIIKAARFEKFIVGEDG